MRASFSVLAIAMVLLVSAACSKSDSGGGGGGGGLHGGGNGGGGGAGSLWTKQKAATTNGSSVIGVWEGVEIPSADGSMTYTMRLEIRADRMTAANRCKVTETGAVLEAEASAAAKIDAPNGRLEVTEEKTSNKELPYKSRDGADKTAKCSVSLAKGTFHFAVQDGRFYTINPETNETRLVSENKITD